MGFEYERDTRRFYRDRCVARHYHDAFSRSKGWRALRFRFIAARERRTVRLLLTQVPHERVVDVPAGTGKMAPVFAELGSRVLSCDVSPSMLELAEETYEELEYDRVSFAVVDLEEATESIETTFDVTVCVRLMHRVPARIKRRMLEEIGRLSPVAIVSFAIQNPYHDVRRAVRRLLFGGEDVGLDTRHRRGEIEELIRETHEIIDRRPVARGLSAEWVYLLDARW